MEKNQETIENVTGAFSERSTCGQTCYTYISRLYDLTCSKPKVLYFVASYGADSGIVRSELYSFYSSHDFFGVTPPEGTEHNE